MSEKRYTIEVTENQLNLIKCSLEEYFRISLNQWFDVSNRLAFKNYDYKADLDRNGFDRNIQARDTAEKVFKAVGDATLPSLTGLWDHDDLSAADMWRIIRHFQWVERGSQNNLTVDADEPYLQSGEPPIIIKKIE